MLFQGIHIRFFLDNNLNIYYIRKNCEAVPCNPVSSDAGIIVLVLIHVLALMIFVAEVNVEWQKEEQLRALAVLPKE